MIITRSNLLYSSIEKRAEELNFSDLNVSMYPLEEAEHVSFVEDGTAFVLKAMWQNRYKNQQIAAPCVR